MSASIPHTSEPAARGADLRVTGTRMHAEPAEARLHHQRPAPVVVSSAAAAAAEAVHRVPSFSSRSRSPPAASQPLWSPGGSEGRFGPDGGATASAVDPSAFLRRGTGEWAHSLPPQPTEEDRWREQHEQRQAARAASASPPRAGGSRHVSPSHPPAASRGRRRSRASATTSRSCSASTSAPASPHPFLRAHTGGHAHPHLPPQRREHEDTGEEEIEFELSGELFIDERASPVRQQQQEEQHTSPLDELPPSPIQRRPVPRRSHDGVQGQDALTQPAPSVVHQAAASPVTSAPAPGSTIASFIQRFRQQPPQPPSSRQAALPFWWAQPGAIAPPSSAAGGTPFIPPLPLPPQGTSTAEHLRQLEQQIDSQREQKRQQKLQQLAQELSDQQERETKQQQSQAHQSAVDASFSSTNGGANNFSGDLSLLQGLGDLPSSPTQSAAAAQVANYLAQSTRQPRQSILDDSDDFSALLPPSSTNAQSQQAAVAATPQRHSSFPAPISASPDVDDLLRRWRAERAGAAVHPVPSSGAHASFLRSARPSIPADENSIEVDQLIAKLKKRLGIDEISPDEDALTMRLKQQQQQQQQRRPLANLDSQAYIAQTMTSSSSPLHHRHPLPTMKPTPRRKSLSSSPERLTARSHQTLEEMLRQPRVAEAEYLDSARGVAKDEPSKEQQKVSLPRVTLPTIPPLKLPLPDAPVSSSAASAVSPPRTPPRSTTRTAHTERSEEDTPATQRSPPPARSARIQQPQQPEAAVEAKYSEPAPPAASSSVAPSAAPSSEQPAPHFDHSKHEHCAELLRRELRHCHKKKRRSSSSKRGGPRGIISIHISPALTTAASQSAFAAVNAAESATAAAPSVPASVAAASDAASHPAVAPFPVAAESAAPSVIHYISNAPPHMSSAYPLPSSPPRHREAASVVASTQTSPVRPGGDGRHEVAAAVPLGSFLQEVVTRGLQCDPDAYASILQQLQPVHQPLHQHDEEQQQQQQQQQQAEEDQPQHGIAAAEDDEEKKEAHAPEQHDAGEASTSTATHAAAAHEPEALASVQPVATAAVPPTAASEASAVAAARAPASAVATPLAMPYFTPPPFMPYGYGQPLPFYPQQPPPAHMQHLLAQQQQYALMMQQHMMQQQQPLPPPHWNAWYSAAPPSAVPVQLHGTFSAPPPPPQSWPSQPASAPAPHVPPPASSSSSSEEEVFSPSHAHLSRLCAELGVTVAEYRADAPLRALVQQLDRLHTQQAQAQVMQQQQQQASAVHHDHQA